LIIAHARYHREYNKVIAHVKKVKKKNSKIDVSTKCAGNCEYFKMLKKYKK